MRPPSQISSGVDSWTSPLWYAVCTLVFSFSSARGGRVTLRSPRYVQQPAALSSTNRNTQAELLGENMLPLRPPARPPPRPPPAPNRALGTRCNLTECQTALLDWAFLEFSRDRSVRDEQAHRGWEWHHNGNVLFFCEGLFFLNKVDGSLSNQIDCRYRTTTPGCAPVCLLTPSVNYVLLVHEHKYTHTLVGGHVPELKRLNPLKKKSLSLHFLSM